MTDRGVDEDKRATLRRFAALGAAGAAAGLAGTAAAEGSDAREAIAGYLATTPGAHFSKIRDDLKLGTGETQHHLHELADAGSIESYRDGDYRRFFPAGRFDGFERTALGYLRRETPRKMLLSLLREPGATGTELAATADVSRPTISKHATALEDAGVIVREDGYRVTRPETVIALLLRYADSFGEETVTFADEANGLIAYDP